MLSKISVLSLAFLIAAASVASNVSSQEAKPTSVSWLISQLASPDRQEQLKQQGYQDGYETGKEGLDADSQGGIEDRELTDPTEQRIYAEAYASGYIQSRIDQNNTPTPTTSPTSTITPTPTTSPTPIVSAARRAELERRGYQDGYERARSGLGADAQRGIGTLGLTDRTEQRIYANAYSLGYNQYQQANRPTPTTSPTPIVSPERRAELERRGYQDGYERARAGAAAASTSGINRLGLTNPTEQRIYASAYASGYNQYQVDQANRPTPTPSPTAVVSPERRAELERQAYQDGYRRARAGAAAAPDSGINRLGLTDPTEQRLYADAYARGYEQYRVDQANSNQEGVVEALW